MFTPLNICGACYSKGNFDREAEGALQEYLLNCWFAVGGWQSRERKFRGLMALRRQCLQATQMALFRPANKKVSQDIRISFIRYFSCIIYNHVYSVQTENKNIFSKILVCNMCEFSLFYIRSLYSVCVCVCVYTGCPRRNG